MTSMLTPLADITNMHVMQANKRQVKADSVPRDVSAAKSAKKMHTHNPYNWKCLPDDATHAAIIIAQRALIDQQKSMLTSFTNAPAPTVVEEPVVPVAKEFPPAQSQLVCRCLVQFKCHQTEYSSPITLEKGQYVVVQGDRGMDIGVVIRINTDAAKSYVERTGPSGTVLRHATQREVDYWATDLKADEATALEHCRARVARAVLPMEVRHAEYQFDKKKLTFYYDSKARVDFVTLLKELYREFGCRIWMEKVRPHE